LALPRPLITSRPLRGRPTSIFENHATAILPWAELKKDIKEDLYLITLDHHTDTNPSYLRSLFQQVGRNLPLMEELRKERVDSINISSSESMLKALDGLYHDEHIDLSIRCGIFKRAFVIQHSHHSLLPEWEKQSMTVFPTECDLSVTSNDDRDRYFDRALEDDFLTRQLHQLPLAFSLKKHPYILDIDLDYFKTKKSLIPVQSECIKHLIDQASAITIAKESEWVQRLFCDDMINTDDMIDILYRQLVV
jgi:hypothetical protein